MKAGTHLTLRMTMWVHLPEWSLARAGRSPMQLTFCGFPSMPVIVSAQGRVLMRSDRCGWQCQEHPLSMTAQHASLASGIVSVVADLALGVAQSRARPDWGRRFFAERLATWRSLLAFVLWGLNACSSRAGGVPGLLLLE